MSVRVKMEQKQRFFIYDRKEMGMLMLLGLLVAAFAFTLGIHLGKKAGDKTFLGGSTDSAPVATLGDKVPSRQELTEQGKGSQQAVEESLNQSLHDEVARTGIKLDKQRQVDLPSKAKGEPANSAPKKAAKAENAEPAAVRRVSPMGKFTLQIGSFPAMEEAHDVLDSMETLNLKPFMRAADVKGKKWYRVFLGGYDSKEEAEEAGQRYHSQHVLDSFIVQKIPE